ncbi:MAG: glucose-1-phosphate adenylyltransferase [Nitrospira sp.]|nr:glucose-1-phosphate adenylyltransferase [Nitrospira sp.]MDH4251569.1 glucose-1-phosphate adenylyltransferase [Nitrospira sp.]MDH4342539.1 glucose-1-phosphate adenylyltransferase [Nitrospira sp.]MDH5337551.1 glucose-1-phosphate adenylyltransferase [Nitrospira sp.]
MSSPGNRVLAIIMAGGKGERLMPLTELRSKPAVPFGGKYRIVDFVLSNFLNSGIMAMYVLVQYRSQSLIEHLRRAWRIGGRIQQHFITVVPPQMKARGGWYEGTADAVYHNVNLVRDFAPDLVAVFGADHIYRMDINQMIQVHYARQADVTVAALPVPLHAASGFGIIETEPDGRVIGFEEKPSQPKPMPQNHEQAYSSMGNYLFNTDLLVRVLEEDASQPGSHDFGRNIIPHLIQDHRVMAYNFCDNAVPGTKPYEERGYWRDVGTLEAYWQAHMDMLGATPLFDLRNQNWPILTDTFDGPTASFARATIEDSIVGQGSLVNDANIRRSVIGRNVHIDHGAQVDECVILDGARIGAKARLRRVIADRFNVIPESEEIGFVPEADAARYQTTASGLVVLPRGVPRGKGLLSRSGIA